MACGPIGTSHSHGPRGLMLAEAIFRVLDNTTVPEELATRGTDPVIECFDAAVAAAALTATYRGLPNQALVAPHD